MPIPALARKDFARVMEAALSDFTVKRAWAFVNDGKVVIRATRRFKQTSRDTRGELLVTFGAPNFAERRQLASMRRRGVAVPKGVQTKPFPAKKKAAAKKRKTA